MGRNVGLRSSGLNRLLTLLQRYAVHHGAHLRYCAAARCANWHHTVRGGLWKDRLHIIRRDVITAMDQRLRFGRAY